MKPYREGQEVEVFVTDFQTPGFPRVWKRGTVDRIEPIGDGLTQVFVRRTIPGNDHPAWECPIVGKRGGNRNIRPVKPVSINSTKGSPVDVNTIWNDHVARWTWIGMGAKPVLRAEDHLSLDIYLGAGTHKRRLVIKLNGSDLYDIEIGHLHRRSLEWIIDGQALDIDAENLDGALRDLYDSIK